MNARRIVQRALTRDARREKTRSDRHAARAATITRFMILAALARTPGKTMVAALASR